MVSIPKTQTAIVFAHSKADIRVVNDHPVTQQSQLKVGEALVKVGHHSRHYRIQSKLNITDPRIEYLLVALEIGNTECYLLK
jgi:hypothetical protein